MQAAGCGVLGLTCAAIQLHSAVRPCDHRVPYRGGPRARRERTSCMSHPADRVVEECAHDGARRLVHVHARVRAGDRRDPSDENSAAATSGLISLVATRSATPLVRAQSADPVPRATGVARRATRRPNRRRSGTAGIGALERRLGRIPNPVARSRRPLGATSAACLERPTINPNGTSRSNSAARPSSTTQRGCSARRRSSGKQP
jgi:hypothetical protein